MEKSHAELLAENAKLKLQVEKLESALGNVENRESNQKWLQLVLEEIPVPIYMVNPKTKTYLFGNTAMHDLFGRNIAVGEDRAAIANELVAYEEGTERKMSLDEYPSSMVLRGEPVEDYKFIWKVGGKSVNVSVTASILPEMFGNPGAIIIAVNDITTLQKEREYRERFVMAITHDLRTPLTTAKISAQLLSRYPDNVDTVKVVAKRISDSVDRSDRMIRDLLDAHVIKSGGEMPLQVQVHEMNAILNSTVADIKNIHGERFEVISENAKIEGYWDASGIRRIIENLTSNAVKYGSKDGIITIKLSKFGRSEVEMAVHNTGDAIPEDVQSIIFSQFSRTKSAITSGQEGWGVGLTLVKGIAEAHRGSVRVASSPKSGTTFTVRLPLDARKD